MPPKTTKKFEGEGNPVEVAEIPSTTEVIEPERATGPFTISIAEQDVLRKVLDRDRTSRLVHGGLRSLLTLSDDDERVLLAFLRRF